MVERDEAEPRLLAMPEPRAGSVHRAGSCLLARERHSSSIHLQVLFRDLLLYNFVVYTRTGAVLVHAGDEPRIDAVMNFAPDYLNEQSFFSLVVGFLRAVEEAQVFVTARLDAPASSQATGTHESMFLRG